MTKTLYLRHFSVLVGGSAIAQLINLASYPFLTRLYSPEAFGIFAIVVSVASMIGAVSCARFELGIPSARPQERFAAYRLSITIAVGVATLTSIGFLIYALADRSLMAPWLAPLLGLAVFLTGYNNAASLLLLREGEFGLRSSAIVLRTAMTAVPQIILFHISPDALGLVLGFCIGFAAQGALLTIGIQRKAQHAKQSPRRMLVAFRRYWRQAMVDVPSTLLAAIVANAMNFFIMLLYTPSSVGFYALAYRLTVLPLALLSNSLSELFFQRAAQSYRESGVFWNEFKFNLVSASILAIVVFAGLILLARPAVDIYLGSGWKPVGDITIYLAPMLAARFVALSVCTAPQVIRRPHWLLGNNLALAAAMAGTFGLAAALDAPLLTFIMWNAAAMSFVYVGFVLFMAWQTWTHYRIVR